MKYIYLVCTILMEVLMIFVIKMRDSILNDRKLHVEL